ncbi:MAG TPA: hypothetical protein VMV62_02240 [Candidatus Paceibacterota bacterium]|nr:hypothetical protein [Candidatus Paceibacterota bacterium]
MTPTTTTEAEQHAANTADADIFSFFPFVSYAATALGASFLMVCLAILFPWNGGRSTSTLALFFGFAVAGSLYALTHGYLQLLKRGMKGWSVLAWSIAVLVSIALSIDIILFGSTITGSLIVFPGSGVLTSPIIFAALILFQASYFLIEAVLVAATDHDGERGVREWYLSGYLWILSINSAAVIVGLLIFGYFRALW